MSENIRSRIRGELVADQELVGPFTHGLRYQDFSDVEIRNVSLKDSPSAEQGFRFHNARKNPSINVDGQAYNLVLSECSVERVGGDGIYVTAVDGTLIENCKVIVSSGKDADCCQFAYQGDDKFISRNALLRGNVFTYLPDTDSGKGALVFGETENCYVEYCLLEGHNFAYSSIGNHAVTRSCIMRTGRMHNYSFGYGIGSPSHLRDHHIYDCLIESSPRGLALTGFKDDKMVLEGLTGAQRADVVVHDNVFSGCDIGFFADRPWSGSIYRNIFMKCDMPVTIKGGGSQIVTSGQRKGQVLGPVYLNDGSFLCVEPPTLAQEGKGDLVVTEGRWTSKPDEVTYIWRENGIDLMVPDKPGLSPGRSGQFSCVVLARSGKNWMLAVAEMPWAGNSFVPRSYREGSIPWGNRYPTFTI